MVTTWGKLTLAIPMGEAASDAAGAMFEAFVET